MRRTPPAARGEDVTSPGERLQTVTHPTRDGPLCQDGTVLRERAHAFLDALVDWITTVPVPASSPAEIVNVATAAARVGLSAETLYRAARSGAPFARKIGRRVLVDWAELQRWLARG